MIFHMSSLAKFLRVIFHYFLTYQFKHVLGAQKNHLIETVLLSTDNMFWLRNKNNDFQIRALILSWLVLCS